LKNRKESSSIRSNCSFCTQGLRSGWKYFQIRKRFYK